MGRGQRGLPERVSSNLTQMTDDWDAERIDEGLCYRLMRPGEEKQVCALVACVFSEFIAPGFAPEGVEAFLDYAQPDALLRRSLGDHHFVLVATMDARIVAAIEMRDNEHISLLFVDKVHQGRGIGRELVQRALQACASVGPGPAKVSVNSSLSAASFYERLGFQQMSPPQVQDGIRFVPMELRRRSDDG